MTFVFLLFGLAACRAAKGGNTQNQSTSLTPPEQFLVDKEADVAGIVKIRHVENRWVILPDGDNVSLLIVDCEMEQIFAGAKGWPVGTVQPVVQMDYSDLLFDAIAPPAIEGRRYVLWALVTSEDGEVPPLAPWSAHPQGFLLVRGKPDREFIFWARKSYRVSEIHKTLQAGSRVPLDQIVDPVRRLAVAEDRMRRGALGNSKAFIHGLLVNVVDPEGQAKRVERPAETTPLQTCSG